jgi:glycosyltransferase involved in cell wall biosynthesis
LRIAQIAPLMEDVPPRLYGGTERIVSYLTEELIRQGHDVTLFATGDSQTTARLVACAPSALRLDPSARDPLRYLAAMFDRVRSMADTFDVIHFHTDVQHFAAFRTLWPRAVTTLHGRQDIPEAKVVFRHPEIGLISISQHQRLPIAGARFLGNVYHGLPADLHRPVRNPSADYLVFLGRISPEKRPDRAIEIARRLGMRLVLAAKVDKVDRTYFHERIETLLGDGVDYIGEIGEREKTALLANAAALVFPIDWPEPFGLVMIEAMACGTPVLAFDRGSVSEIIEPGVTGVIVDSMDEAVEALPALLRLDRSRIRRRFDERFTATRMASDYVAIYRRLLRQDETGADRSTSIDSQRRKETLEPSHVLSHSIGSTP